MTRFILGALTGMVLALGLFSMGYASASSAPPKVVVRAPTDMEMLAAWWGPLDKSQLVARTCGIKQRSKRK